MKLNKIFMALAAMAIVGCSSDDLNVAAPEQAVDDSRLVELNPNFVLAGVGVEDTGTRTHWEQDATTKALKNKFLPIWESATVADEFISQHAKLDAQAVGLCWLGQGAVGTDVYTNYQFYHFGWLNNGETEAKIECDELTNGALYSDIKTTATGVADAEAVPGTDWTVAGLPAKSVKAAADNLNYNSGVYKTDNKSIFGGDYIVYYPFNENFKEAGTIPAKAETEFNPVSTDFDTPELGLATFRYSAPVTIAGGDQASDFGLYNLSSLVQLKVYAPDGDAAIGARQVDQIVLWSELGQLYKQANLAADKIVAGKKGAELYAETEGTKTISAKFAAGDEVELAKKADADPGAFITVLPTTVSDLKVLVHSTDLAGDDGKWATLDKANTEFKAGSAKVLDICVANADWKADYIAVDDASLRTALAEARVVAVDADHAATITVIGDITLTTDLGINNANDAFITITGDAIIVPEDVTLTVKTNMASDLRVLGKSCCTGGQGGRLTVAGGTISNVTMEETEASTKDDTNNPEVQFTTAAATVAAGSTFDVQAGKVIVSKPVAFKGDVVIAEGANLTVDGNGSFKSMGAKVTNNGTIEVQANGQYNMASADGTSATATDGKRMTNGETGVFIHNVDAGVGTAVQSMHQNGEYRCKVNSQNKLDDAYNLWTACNVIEMVEAGTTYDLVNAKQHGGKYVDIEVNTGTATTFTKDGAKDNLNINIGKLTVTAGGLRVNFVSYTPTGGPTYQRSLTVNGDVTAKANLALQASKKIDVKGNLTVDGATTTLLYKGNNVNAGGLAVTKDITVSGGTFNAYEDDALNITCANFYLADGAEAKFGNRTSGGSTTMAVTGTINNPKLCTFTSKAATGTNLLPHITCTTLLYGGTFTNYEPQTITIE